MQRLSKTSIPFFVLGGGSNLLVLDGGIPGVGIHLRELDQVVLSGEGRLSVEAGFSFPKLSILAQKQSLSGLEFAIGIPGTVGGAVAMNAGVPGEETGSVIEKVTVVTSDGEEVSLSREACRFFYRSTNLPAGIIVSAEFFLHDASPQAIEKKRVDYVKRRRDTQPLTYPNSGSIFKNPGTLLMPSAGKLIEQVRLKGYRIGAAAISEKHGNFIINLGGATAEDVLALMHLMEERVFLEKGIQLIPEIKIVGQSLNQINSGSC
jgi:UDP-N-acetylmuramate dehydrogenase